MNNQSATALENGQPISYCSEECTANQLLLSHLVLPQAQRWVLELLNGHVVKVAVLLPELQQLHTQSHGEIMGGGDT